MLCDGLDAHLADSSASAAHAGDSEAFARAAGAALALGGGRLSQLLASLLRDAHAAATSAPARTNVAAWLRDAVLLSPAAASPMPDVGMRTALDLAADLLAGGAAGGGDGSDDDDADREVSGTHVAAAATAAARGALACNALLALAEPAPGACSLAPPVLALWRELADRRAPCLRRPAAHVSLLLRALRNDIQAAGRAGDAAAHADALHTMSALAPVVDAALTARERDDFASCLAAARQWAPPPHEGSELSR